MEDIGLGGAWLLAFLHCHSKSDHKDIPLNELTKEQMSDINDIIFSKHTDERTFKMPQSIPHCCENRKVDKMKIMQFDEFNKYIQKVKTYIEVDSVVNGELNKLNDDFAKFSCLGLIDEVLNLLVYIFDDRENDWIYYYCFDLNFGAKNDTMKVYTGEGENKIEIPLTTTQDLYNLLVKNMAENEPKA